MLVAAIVVMACFAMLAQNYWSRLFGEGSPLGSPSFLHWLATGLVVPSVGWVFFNCGFIRAWPPLLPEIAIAQASGGSWIPLVFTRTVPGLLTVASYWAAVTFLQLVIVIGVYAESRREYGVIVGVLAVLLSPVAAWVVVAGGMGWAGIGLLIWLLPIVHCSSFLASREESRPMYARAIARMKLGKYEEAESEVIEQLEKCEQDFEGWMMLAELYATQFHDLGEADRTIRGLCRQSGVPSLQISMALHRLADWHLKSGNDPVAARSALEEIVLRLPGTHFAHMAQLRCRQLPASRQEWHDQQKPKTLRMPALLGSLEDTAVPEPSHLSRVDAAALANECVVRLQRNPNDAGSREKFARILVEDLGKTELGFEQMELLIAAPGVDEAKRAEWLSRLAGWQWGHRHDRSAVKQTLHRLIREHPQSAQAFAAQRWLSLLEMEERHLATSSSSAPPRPSY